MMGYYDEQRKAYKKIADRINEVIHSQSSLDVDSFVIKLTEDFGCSERACRRRIELVASKSGCLILEKGEIKYANE